MISSGLFALRYRRFLAACENPLAAQARCLRRILAGARNTGIGRAAGFGPLSGIRDAELLIRAYQERVPIRTHADMGGDLDAVRAGDWRSLCPSRPVFFSMTAGSTGHFKYIPVTPEFRRELGHGSMTFYGSMEAACPALRRLRAQFLVGSAEGGHSPGGIPQGFASGFNYRNLPWMVRNRFLLPYWVFTLDDAEERSYAAGRMLCGDRRLGALCAISPVNLINLRQALERQAERLINDVARGTLTLHGPGAVPGTWNAPPDPALATALRASREAGGVLPNRLLFPSLQLLVCWQGGSMGYYLDELDTQFGINQHFEFPVSASEGLFAVPLQCNQPGGALAVTSHFLEFVPDSASTGAGAPALRADQLEPGREYRLVVTNASGFYRYDMEDVVRVTSFCRRTPVIEFVAKTGRRVSVANERLTESDVTTAMQAAARASATWFPEFLFVPCSDRRLRVLVDGASIEALGSAGRQERLQRFIRELEHQLRLAAKGYDFEREDALLEPLQLVVTRAGEFRAWLARTDPQPGIPSAQTKPRHLATEFNLHQAFHPELTCAP